MAIVEAQPGGAPGGRIVGLRAILILLVSLGSGSPAEAAYRIQFAQMSEPPGVRDSGSWVCSDAEMKSLTCLQGIIMTIDGRPAPIQVRLGGQGGVLRVRMAAGAWLLAVQSDRPLVFSRDGIFESSLTLWETNQPITSSLPQDLVWRPGYRALATMILAVKRVPDSARP